MGRYKPERASLKEARRANQKAVISATTTEVGRLQQNDEWNDGHHRGGQYGPNGSAKNNAKSRGHCEEPRRKHRDMDAMIEQAKKGARAEAATGNAETMGASSTASASASAGTEKVCDNGSQVVDVQQSPSKHSVRDEDFVEASPAASPAGSQKKQRKLGRKRVGDGEQMLPLMKDGKVLLRKPAGYSDIRVQICSRPCIRDASFRADAKTGAEYLQRQMVEEQKADDNSEDEASTLARELRKQRYRSVAVLAADQMGVLHK